MSLISNLFEIRSRKSFSANDITLWLVDSLGKLFGISTTQIQTEVIIKGKSKGREVAREMQLAVGDVLDWEIELRKNRKVMIVKKLE